MSRPCPLCDHLGSLTLGSFPVISWLDSWPAASSDLLACGRCGATFTDSTVDDAALSRWYHDHSSYERPTTSGTGGSGPADQLRYLRGAALLRGLGADPEAPVADVGCGKGGGLLTLRDAGFRQPYGFEPDPRLAELARQTVDAEVRKGALPHLDADDGSFGAILCGHVLEHLLDPLAALRELRRLLRPDGLLVLEVPDATRYSARPVFDGFWLSMKEHVGHFGPESLRAALQRAGFACVAVEQDDLPILGAAMYPALRIAAKPAPISTPAAIELERPALEQHIATERAHALRRGAGLRAAGIERWAAWGISHELFGFAALSGLRLSEFGLLVDRDPARHGGTVDGAVVQPPTAIAELALDGVVATAVFHAAAIARGVAEHHPGLAIQHFELREP